MHWNDNWTVGGMWILMMIGPAYLIFLVWMIVKVIQGESSRESPEDILKRRPAGGEINSEEYNRLLEDLRK